MRAMVQCLSHTPLVGHVDPDESVLDEVNSVIGDARARITNFDPELVILFAPDHYNGFFYDIMPPFCIGIAAHAIGDFGSAKGPLKIPCGIAEDFVSALMDEGIDTAVSYRMQVDHGFAQPLEFLLGGLEHRDVVPVFINSVAVPLPSFQRARLLGEAMGRFARKLDKRVLFIGSGGLSHEPPVPELATADERMTDRLLGSGRNLPPEERQARTDRVINAARRFTEDQNTLHPLNPEWDQSLLDVLCEGRMTELDDVRNQDVSRQAGKSTHEVKSWVAAFAALGAFGPYQTSHRYYRPIPEWIAGFGALSASPSNAE